MAISSNIPPQEFLDKMHEVDVPALFVPKIPPRRRETLVQKAQKDLAAIQTRLHSQMERIKSRYPRRNREEAAALEIAPYARLDALLNELIGQVNQLDETMKAGRMLPQGFDLPTVIFGTPQTGEWFFGESDDARLWEETETLKSRYEGLLKEREPLIEEIKTVKADIQEATDKLKKLMDKYQRRSKRSTVNVQLLILFLLAVLAAAGAGLLLTQTIRVGENDLIIGGGAAGLALLMLILMPVIYSGWKQGVAKLKDQIEQDRRDLKALKERGKNLQQRYIPMTDTLKETYAEYKRLRATFT